MSVQSPCLMTDIQSRKNIHSNHFTNSKMVAESHPSGTIVSPINHYEAGQMYRRIQSWGKV